MTIDTVPCPECRGYGWIDMTWGVDPSDRDVYRCRHCDGFGEVDLVDCDMESLLEAGLEITKQDAIARLEAEGFNAPGEAEAIWRRYRGKETERWARDRCQECPSAITSPGRRWRG